MVINWFVRRRAKNSALGALILSTLFASVAQSSVWEPPNRTLSEADKLNLSISDSDAIAVATISNLQDVLVNGWRHHSISVQLLTWLKESAFGPPPTQIEFSPGAEQILKRLPTDLRAGPRKAIVFLRHTPVGWVIQSSPYDYQLGIAILDGANGQSVVGEVTKAISDQSMERLANHADAIVIGYTSGSDTCRIQGAKHRCAIVDVSEVIAGEISQPKIKVYALFRVDSPRDTTILFLRRTDGDLYEILSAEAGELPIHQGRVGPSGQKVSDTADQIRALRKQR